MFQSNNIKFWERVASRECVITAKSENVIRERKINGRHTIISRRQNQSPSCPINLYLVIIVFMQIQRQNSYHSTIFCCLQGMHIFLKLCYLNLDNHFLSSQNISFMKANTFSACFLLYTQRQESHSWHSIYFIK